DLYAQSLLCSRKYQIWTIQNYETNCLEISAGARATQIYYVRPGRPHSIKKLPDLHFLPRRSTMTTTDSPAMIGARVDCVEDSRLTSGRGRYLDDVTPADCLHLRFVRSPHSRARIESIDVEALSGDSADAVIFTGDDLGDVGIRADTAGSGQSALQPVLARGQTRYVGEPVAAVLHSDPYTAEDAAEDVVVDYTPLDPVIDLRSAMMSNAPLVHENWDNNVFIRRRRTFGDLDAARQNATRVIRNVIRTHRQSGVPLENRGCIAVPDVDGLGITLWSSTQMPHLVRTYVANELGLDERDLRVVAPEVGGGFGIKGHVFGEEILVTMLAMRLNSAVKWVEDRSEHLISSPHARDHIHRIEAYVDDSGRILGLRGQIVVDAGAYSVYPWTAGSDSGMVPKVMIGPYDIQNVDWDDVAIATNKAP